jgi:isopentenyl-diphosphate delta-isomerase
VPASSGGAVFSEAPASSGGVVSSDAEELILVDTEGTETGFATKRACHDGDGILHRAFSLFVFTSDGRLLLQRRGWGKRLWPGYWANSCCSHPRRGEAIDAATHRRLREELGVDCGLEFLFTFAYHARFGEVGSERELCSVYAGMASEPIRANTTEIAETRLVVTDELDSEIAAAPGEFTPWLRLEWPRVRPWLDPNRLPG